MSVKTANFFTTTLSVDLAAADTAITVTSLAGLPTFSAPDYAYLVLSAGSYREVVKLTANDGSGAQPITRAQDGTIALDWSTGDTVRCDPTQGTMDDIQAVADAAIPAPASPSELDFLSYDSATTSWIASKFLRILQIVPVIVDDQVDITSTNMTDTGVSLDITPISDSSTIYILGKFSSRFNHAGSGYAIGYYQIKRVITDSTIVSYDHIGIDLAGSIEVNSGIYSTSPIFAYDSPSSTEKCTYTLQAKVVTAGKIECQYGSTVKSILVAIEVGA